MLLLLKEQGQGDSKGGVTVRPLGSGLPVSSCVIQSLC